MKPSSDIQIRKQKMHFLSSIIGANGKMTPNNFHVRNRKCSPVYAENMTNGNKRKAAWSIHKEPAFASFHSPNHAKDGHTSKIIVTFCQ